LVKGLNAVLSLEFFNAKLAQCTKHAFKKLLLAVRDVSQQHKHLFMGIVMAGTMEYQETLLVAFGNACDDETKQWIINSIRSYGLN